MRSFSNWRCSPASAACPTRASRARSCWEIAAALLARLADEYVFAELCEALTLSYAAENEARVRAMAAAQENVARKLDELSARSRQIRQEQITDELIELAAGAQAR